MYEALGLALQAQQAPAEEVERAIMSAADLSGNAEEIMLAAVYLARLGHESRALKLLQEVAQTNPSRPEPYVQGLELARRLNDAQGVQWAVTHILQQAWPKEQRHVQDKAVRIAQATLQELLEKSPGEAESFRAAVQQAIARDCLVKVSWTGDADVDVMVEEPAGTVCSLRNQRTTSGGVLLGDAFAHATDKSSEMSETYVCPEGFAGRYRVLVRRIWGDVTAGKVTVDVYTNQHTPQQKHMRQQIPLADKDALVVFELPEGRRSESLTEHQIASVANTQAAINRAVSGAAAQYGVRIGGGDAVSDGTGGGQWRPSAVFPRRSGGVSPGDHPLAGRGSTVCHRGDFGGPPLRTVLGVAVLFGHRRGQHLQFRHG